MEKSGVETECELVTFSDRQIEIAREHAEGSRFVVMEGLSHVFCGYGTYDEALNALFKNLDEPEDTPDVLKRHVVDTSSTGRPVFRGRTRRDGYAEALEKARRLREAQLCLGQTFLEANPDCWWALVSDDKDHELAVERHGNDPSHMDGAWEEAIKELGKVPIAVRKKFKHALGSAVGEKHCAPQQEIVAAL